MDIVYRHIEFVTWILSIVTSLLSIVASMLSHVHHRIARPLGPPYFSLHKAVFHDAVALRYGWPLQRTPSHCACGAAFSVDHALSCPKVDLPSLRHNEIRDLTARLLTEVCHQVQVEPELQPVSNPDTFSHATANSQEGAQLDIVIN